MRVGEGEIVIKIFSYREQYEREHLLLGANSRQVLLYLDEDEGEYVAWTSALKAFRRHFPKDRQVAELERLHEELFHEASCQSHTFDVGGEGG